jgi:hypothetical protein
VKFMKHFNGIVSCKSSETSGLSSKKINFYFKLQAILKRNI